MGFAKSVLLCGRKVARDEVLVSSNTAKSGLGPVQERAVWALERGDGLQAGGMDSRSSVGTCAPENHHGGASLKPNRKRKPKHAPQGNGFGFRLGAPQAFQGQSVNYAA